MLEEEDEHKKYFIIPHKRYSKEGRQVTLNTMLTLTFTLDEKQRTDYTLNTEAHEDN